MKYDIKIMGCPQRLSHIVYICNKLGLDFTKDVFVDYKERHNPLMTAIDIWNMPYENDVTHRVIIQDDVDVCDNFRECVSEMIKIHPDVCYSLFHRSEKYKEMNPFTIVNRGGDVSGQTIILKTDWMSIMAKEASKITNVWHSDDTFTSDFCRRNKIKVYTTIPCMVSHLGANSTTFSSNRHPRYNDKNSYLGSGLIYDNTKISLNKAYVNLNNCIKDYDILLRQECL